LAATCALPTSTTATAVILSSVQDEPQSRRPRFADAHGGPGYPPCDMPRSERCRIRGNCLDGIALPSLAQAPVARAAERLALVRRPPASGDSSDRSEPSNGLEPSGDRRRVWASGRKADSKGMGAAGGRAKAELEGDRVRAGSACASAIFWNFVVGAKPSSAGARTALASAGRAAG
jgi:hypothetical protein